MVRYAAIASMRISLRKGVELEGSECTVWDCSFAGSMERDMSRVFVFGGWTVTAGSEEVSIYWLCRASLFKPRWQYPRRE